MKTQIERMGDGYIVRLRTRDTVYLWAHLFLQEDCRKWAADHLAEAEAMARSRDAETVTEPPNI
jgi:hypothetical protein